MREHKQASGSALSFLGGTSNQAGIEELCRDIDIENVAKQAAQTGKSFSYSVVASPQTK